MKGQRGKLSHRDTPDPRRSRSAAVSRRAVYAAAAVAVAVAAAVWLMSSAPIKQEAKQQQAKQEQQQQQQQQQHELHDEWPLLAFEPLPVRQWEPEFQCDLWATGIGEQLTRPPYVAISDQLRIKEARSAAGRLYRVLAFDDSGEIQGAVEVDPTSHKMLPNLLVMEYVRGMAGAVLAAPFLHCKQPAAVLSLGLGAGSLASYMHHMLPKARVDVIEIDPQIADAAQKHLGTPAPSDRFRLFLGDAARVDELIESDATYDVILHDAYMPGPRVPPTLLTEEYLRSLSRRLRPGGVLVFNFCLSFYSSARQVAIVQRFLNVFETVRMVESTPTSKLLIAHNFEAPPNATQTLVERLRLMQRECEWPENVRSMEYHLVLPKQKGLWEQQWLRQLHQEVSRYRCSIKRLTNEYCGWFAVRDRLSRKYPRYSVGSMKAEEFIRKARSDMDEMMKLAAAHEAKEQQLDVKREADDEEYLKAYAKRRAAASASSSTQQQ